VRLCRMRGGSSAVFRALIAGWCLSEMAACGALGRRATPVEVEVRPQAAPDPDGTELARGQAGPEFIAVDEGFVYWTNFEDDRVLKIPKEGLGVPIESGRNDRGENKAIATDAVAVYWGGTALYRQAKADGRIRRFDFGSVLAYNPVPIDGRIYWIDGGKHQIRLISMKSDGTDVRTIGPPEQQDFIFATDGSVVYRGRFRQDADDAGEIDVLPVHGGSPERFEQTRWLWKLVLDRDYVYWLEGRNVGTVKKKPRLGGPTTVLVDGIPRPQSLAADGEALYWTELGAGTGQGAIGKVAKSGGEARRLAKRQIVPQALAVDDTSVYWVNFGPTNNGTVRKIAK